MEIIMKAIGYIRSVINNKSDLPMQSVLNPDQKATIEILPEFAEGLQGIDEGSYRVILFNFHESTSSPLQLISGATGKKTGVFNTRSPNRPNGIGLSIVKITNVDGNIIEFEGVDMLDGTPVLDIKPYAPQTTSQSSISILNLEGGDAGFPSPYTHYYRGPGAYKMELIFDSMLQPDKEGLIPWLAKDWTVDERDTSYTFKIRENVTWHDGEPMTTEDIKFSFDYYKDHPPVKDLLNRSHDDYVEEINLIDDYTINIKIKSPDATLLERFGSARILPKHIWENVDDPLKFNDDAALIGCGPYMLTDYSKEQGAYKFQAFKEYWGPKPAVDAIHFIPVSDSILAFENGDIDLTNITPDILPKYQDDPHYKIISNPAFWGYRIRFNMDKQPELKDKDLRQAIAYAIDQDELIEKIARGGGKPASPGYLPVDHVMYNDMVKPYEFNLEKSKELLKGKNYEFILLIGDTNPEVRIAELLKLNLEKVGVTLNITSIDSKSRDAAVKNHEYELVLYGHGGWGYDPDTLRKEYSSEFGNIPGYSNSHIDQLSNDQLLAPDIETRKEIIYKLQEVIAEELPQIPLYNTTTYTGYMPAKYDRWKHTFNHDNVTYNKLSFLEMD